LGEFYAYKSGHALNNKLLQALFSDENNYKVVTKNDNVN
jgi:UDP-3-O-[3-hydroxymyristoyl] N-acetylglucosamine deacetylase